MTSLTPPFGTFRLQGWRRRALQFAQSRPVSWSGRRLALLARRLVLKTHGKLIDEEVQGIRMRFHTSDNVSERKFLFMPQFCDPFERQFLAQNLSRDGVFLDVGANAGIYALTAAAAYERLGGAGRVHAVEANPGMVERLKANIALNDSGKRVQVAPVALSDKAGSVSFTISNSNLGESGLDTDNGRSIEVQSETLSALLSQEPAGALDGIKIDVEGTEDLVLCPYFASEPRARFPKFIIIEDSSKWWRQDLFGVLRDAGYRRHSEQRMNVIFTLG